MPSAVIVVVFGVRLLRGGVTGSLCLNCCHTDVCGNVDWSDFFQPGLTNGMFWALQKRIFVHLNSETFPF